MMNAGSSDERVTLMNDLSGPPISNNGPPGNSRATSAVNTASYPAAAARSPSHRVGASISALGALLILGGALLPTYGTVDYERHAPVIVGLLCAAALLVFVCTPLAWFRKALWLVVLSVTVLIFAFLIHLLAGSLGLLFGCFDVCPPGGVSVGTGFWLPLIGFPLSIIGLLVTTRRPTTQGTTQPASANQSGTTHTA